MKLKEKIEIIGLDYKKEILILSIIVILSIALAIGGFFLKKIAISIISIFIGCLFSIIYLTRYNGIINKLNQEHENEFIDIINYFEIFLMNNTNIYNAFKEVANYASPWMKDKLEKLIEGMDNDTSVEPFIEFANNFELGIIQNVMISIYQMIDNGQNEISLTQFNLLFEKVELKNNALKMQTIFKKIDSCSIYPMIGSIYLTLLLTGSILIIIGEMING